ncbi:MAG: VacJ family lipoprotein [Deltaproteobacteria bacterium]|nr:VacJ family lipoprotein [Deltaproteobacteria bacterium]
MGTAIPCRFATVLAVTVFLAATGVSREGMADGQTGVRPPFPAVDNAADKVVAATLPWRIPGLTSPPADPAHAAVMDNAAATPWRIDAIGRSPGTITGEDGETELREPDFGREPPPAAVFDPIEPVNRAIFFVNDKLYLWLLKPVAQVYKNVVPEGARVAVRNVFLNLGTPIRAVNALLQGKPAATGTELLRLVINSTLGFGGMVDAANEFHLERKTTDTGLTLGTYGLGHGFYFVLPILGPSSARDAVGVVGDTYLDPLAYLLAPRAALGARFVRSTTDLSFRIGEYEELTGAAVDPYAAVRDAYIQYRAKRLKE